ncbi:hypothetical protein JNB_17363 [Janibacter sp. HTCC2649]|nr:hypothetical protein JNB_17363 [Janibacter sp. HTCC2649]
MLRIRNHSAIARNRNATKAHRPGAACWLGVPSVAVVGLGEGVTDSGSRAR